MPASHMFKYYSDKLRQQPLTSEEREERDRDFGGFSNNQFYRDMRKINFLKKHSRSHQGSDDRYTVRQAYNLIDESDTQMEDLNIRLSFMSEQKLTKATLIQGGKLAASTVVQGAGKYAGSTLGGVAGFAVAGPPGAILGGLGGAILGSYFTKKVYKNFDRELGKKMKWDKTAKGIYPSTKDIDSSISAAYLGADVDAKESKVGAEENILSKNITKKLGVPNLLTKIPFYDMNKIRHELKKAKNPLSVNKQFKIINLLDQLEETLNNEFENVKLPISRLSPLDEGITPSITTAIKEFQNYKMPAETKITLAEITEKYESAKKFIASNRVLIAKLSTDTEWRYPAGAVTDQDLIAKAQADEEEEIKAEIEATALKEGYEGDSLGDTSSSTWNTPL